MPLYPYQCEDCETEFEALVTRSDVPATIECPSCGGTRVQRGFGVPARVGSGALPQTNCAGDGPPCGRPQCGRLKRA